MFIRRLFSHMSIRRLSSHMSHIVALIFHFLELSWLLYHWTSLNYRLWSSLIVSDRLWSPLALKFFPCLCAWLHRPSPHLAWHSAWPLDEPCGLRRKEIAKDFNVLIDIWCIIMYSVYRCKCASRKTNPFGATVHLDLSFPLCHSASGSKMLQKMFQHPF